MNIRPLLATAVFLAVALATVFMEPTKLFQAHAAASNFTITITPGPECYDGQDNDQDGLIDYPDDDDCTSASDDTEGIPPPPAPPAVSGPTPSGSSEGLRIDPTTSVMFSGYAYPGSRIVLLQDAQIAALTTAGLDARFTITLTGLTSGDYLFLLYAESTAGRRSMLHPFSLFLTKGSLTQISSVVLAPTIEIDKIVVRRGDSIRMFGDTAPFARLSVTLFSGEERHYDTIAGGDGVYVSSISTADLPLGEYVLKMSATVAGQYASGYGLARVFQIGDQNVPVAEHAGCGMADITCDGRVDLLDFSIAAYWFRRPLEGPFIAIERDRLNGDGRLDLQDISIMAFYWTG